MSTVQRVWNISAHPGPVAALACSPDGEFLVSVGGDLSGRVWKANSGTTLYSDSVYSDWVWGVACSFDGRFIASTSDEVIVRRWMGGNRVLGNRTGSRSRQVEPASPSPFTRSFPCWPLAASGAWWRCGTWGQTCQHCRRSGSPR